MFLNVTAVKIRNIELWSKTAKEPGEKHSLRWSFGEAGRCTVPVRSFSEGENHPHSVCATRTLNLFRLALSLSRREKRTFWHNFMVCCVLPFFYGVICYLRLNLRHAAEVKINRYLERRVDKWRGYMHSFRLFWASPVSLVSRFCT